MDIWIVSKLGTISETISEKVGLPPAMRETWVRFLGWEDPLEEDMATHSSILAWRIPWTEEPGGLQPMGFQRAGHDLATEHTHRVICHVWLCMDAVSFS